MPNLSDLVTMATLTASAYSHEHYDSLPDIIDAVKALTSTSALEELTSSIGAIFVKHGLENVFGLTLLHRHFDMEPTEMLVAFGNVSVPWDTTSNCKATDQIHPSSWRFLAGGIVPYEFTSNKATVQADIKAHNAFSQELGIFLREKHLDQLLGLCHIDIDSPTTMEFTSGRANVTVPEVMWGQDSESASVEASWQFGTEGTYNQYHQNLL